MKLNSTNTDFNNDKITIIGNLAYLKGAKAAVSFPQKGGQFNPPDASPKNIEIKTKAKEYVPWGETDDFPQKIEKAISSNPTLARGMEFNVITLFGSGIKPVKKITDENGNVSHADLTDADQKVIDFFDDNDINTWFLEQCTDFSHFYTKFDELITNKEGDYIPYINHLEATFSRLEKPDEKTKIIKHHFYSGKFGTKKQIEKDDIDETYLLPSKHTLNHLKSVCGLLSGKDKDKGIRRFALQTKFPSPGRVIYPKPYWTAIIDSGWLDFANTIPEFKKALMGNQMTIKYQVIFSEDYFPAIFKQEKISDPKKQKARMVKELTDMNNFLTDTKNTGKSHVSFAGKYHGRNGHELIPHVQIKPIENPFKGGEWIQDSEEANNIISYAIGVHPLITGATPGKSGSISGTEARELFNIKRALVFPHRWLIIKVLYLIKKYNNWDKDIYFEISDPILTTLDKNKTGIDENKTTY